MIANDLDDRRTRILVFSAFKTASRAAEAILASRLKDQQNYVVRHRHNHPLHEETYDVLVTPLRPHAQIFKSAYFQDLTQPTGYPYSRCLGMPGGPVPAHPRIRDLSPEIRAKLIRVLTTPVNELVSHFMSFPWESYPWLNLNVTLGHINSAHDTALVPRLNPDGYQIHKTTNARTRRPVTILLLEHDVLKDVALLRRMFLEIGLEVRLDAPMLVNVGAWKWYGRLYARFLRAVPEEFDRRYEYLDTIVRGRVRAGDHRRSGPPLGPGP